MAGEQEQRDLFPEAETPQSAVVVNDRCLVRTSDGHRVVVVCGVVLAQYAISDRMAEAYAMVSLVQQGWAVASGFAPSYYATQTEAQSGKRGIWSGSFVPPRQWRQRWQ